MAHQFYGTELVAFSFSLRTWRQKLKEWDTLGHDSMQIVFLWNESGIGGGHGSSLIRIGGFFYLAGIFVVP